jgi:1-acyl-sn-glycerol-3-phosphate acyltransferase
MFAVGLFGMRVALRIAGIRYRVSGQGHLAAERGAVYCINHSSHLDVLAFILLYPLVPRLSILYKHELTSVPVVSSIFELADFIPLDRSHHDDAIRSLAKGVEALRAGRSLLTAPEGTRSPDGRLQSFKKGIFVMAIEAHVPIVPVAVIGAAEALPKGRSIARPGEIVVRIGEAIATDAMSYEDRDRLRQEALDRLRSLLRETPSSARAAGTYPI